VISTPKKESITERRRKIFLQTLTIITRVHLLRIVTLT